MLLGTFPRAVVRCVLCALSGSVAPGGRSCLAPVSVPWSSPAACLSGVPRGPAWCAAPRPVRSLLVLLWAFPTPSCPSPTRRLAPPALLGGCAGHANAGREPGSLCLPLARAEAGALGLLRVVPVRGPAMGLSLAGPSGVGLGLRALRWLACVDPVTDASSFPYRPSSDGGLGRCTGAFFVWTPTPPLAGRRSPHPGPVRVCVCSSVLAGSGRPAFWARSGAPHLFLWLLYLSALLGPLRAGVAPFLVLCFPPPFFFYSFLFSFLGYCFPRTPFVSCFLWFPAPVPGALALCVVCFVGLALLGSPCALASFVLPAWPLAALWWSPPPFVSHGLRFRRSVPCVCFFFLSAPPLSLAFSGFRPWVPWALALCFVFFFFASRFSALRALSPVLCLPLGRWLLPGGCCPPLPLPFCVSRFLSLPLVVVFFPLLVCAPLSLAFSGFRPRVPWALALCFVCFLGLPVESLNPEFQAHDYDEEHSDAEL